MTKQHYKEICNEYDINIRALKEILKKEGLKIKNLNTLEVLQQIYIYAPDLMYCRDAGYDAVEYHNKDIPMKLIKAMSDERA